MHVSRSWPKTAHGLQFLDAVLRLSEDEPHIFLIAYEV
jgi:hypothetical protein